VPTLRLRMLSRARNNVYLLWDAFRSAPPFESILTISGVGAFIAFGIVDKPTPALMSAIVAFFMGASWRARRLGPDEVEVMLIARRAPVGRTLVLFIARTVTLAWNLLIVAAPLLLIIILVTVMSPATSDNSQVIMTEDLFYMGVLILVAPAFAGLLANKINKFDSWVASTTEKLPVLVSWPMNYYIKALKSLFTLSIYIRAVGKPVTFATFANYYMKVCWTITTIILGAVFGAALFAIPAFLSAVPLSEIITVPGLRLDPAWVYPTASITLLFLTEFNQEVKIACAKGLRGMEWHFLVMCALVALSFTDWSTINVIAAVPSDIFSDAIKDMLVGCVLAIVSTLVLDVSQAIWTVMLFHIHPLNTTELEDRSMKYGRWHERGLYREGMVSFEHMTGDGDVSVYGVVYVPRSVSQPEVVEQGLVSALQEAKCAERGFSVGLFKEHNHGLPRALMVRQGVVAMEWHLSVRASSDDAPKSIPADVLFALRQHVPWGWAPRRWSEAWIRVVVDAILPIGVSTSGDLVASEKSRHVRTYTVVLNTDSVYRIHVSRTHGLVAAYLND